MLYQLSYTPRAGMRGWNRPEPATRKRHEAVAIIAATIRLMA